MNLLELSKKQTDKFSSKFKEWLNHAGWPRGILRFYDLLCILNQKDIEGEKSISCVTRRVIHTIHYISRNPSDPLEIPTNSQIQRKSLIYKGFKFVGFFHPLKFQQIHVEEILHPLNSLGFSPRLA